MPPVIVAVAAAAAATVVPGLVAGALAGTALGATLIYGVAVSSVISATAGALAGIVVAYAGSSVLGLNRPPKAANQAGTSVAQDRRQLIRSATAPRVVVYGRARVSGPLIYASSSGEDRRFLHVVVPVAAHRIHSVDWVIINDVRTDRGSIVDNGGIIPAPNPLAGKARVRWYLGDQTEADPDLVAESTDGWTPDHRLLGVSYIYARLEYAPDAYPNGLQNIAAEISGKNDIFDPRNNSFGYSENAALCILDYLRSPDGLACADDEIDLPSFITAANICDERVQIAADGTTQARYHLGGSFALDRTPLDIVEEMLGACAGALVYVQGRYRLFVGAYAAPTDTLTASDLAGPVELITKPSRRELFNAVRGTFIDPDKSWQAADFPPYADPTFVADDGETIWRDIDLPFVNDGIRAQRLARLTLRRSRESLTLRAPVRYAGIRYAVWQMVSVTLPDFGWTAKPFRITAWSFDPSTGLVTLTLREEGASSYAWTFDEALQLGLAPDTDLASPLQLPAVPGLAVSEELYEAGGLARSRAVLTWGQPATPFAIGYDVQFRLATQTEWQTAPGSITALRALVEGLPDGLHVFRVRVRGTLAAGPWSEVQTNIGALASLPPSNVSGLAVQSIGGFAYLRWDLHPDLDVRVGGRIEFRHTPDTVSPTWVGSTSIGEAAPGGATWTILPLKPGTYLAKAVDAGGRYSATEASIGTAQATALAWTSLTTLTENPGFSGVKTDTLVSSSVLRLDTLGDIDSVASFDAIANIDGLGGVRPSGSYAFSGGMDLTTVKRVRVTGRMLASVVNTLNLIDSRSALIDFWGSFDGLVGGEADAWIEVRETNDNPAGTPTWSAWRRLDAAEFQARAFQFRAQLRSYDTAFNIDVTELSVVAEEVA